VVVPGKPPDIQPTYIPHDIAPRLENPAHVQQLLESLYPADYRDAGIGDEVELWLFVDDEGEVARALVRTPSRYAAFNAAARHVARSMEYRPAFNRGRPVGVWVSQPIRFVALPAPKGSVRSLLSGASAPVVPEVGGTGGPGPP
jgi:TonB family protein